MKWIATCILVGGTLSIGCAFASEGDRIAQMSEAYRNGTERDRLLICIDAIDKGLICRGCHVGTMDRIFSTRFSTPDGGAKGYDALYKGVVHFRDEDPRPKETGADATSAASPTKGWYLAFRYTENGSIYDYQLSDLSK
ncbi:hypothetical protein [Lysobacter silvisoli]|nr:hypothetical protein [Lysobacter silvisoli]